MPSMRAAVCREPGRVDVEEVARPTPRADELLVRVDCCGICGSDLHWYHGLMPLPRACPGHEISATVAEVGSGGSRFRAGDRVAIEGMRVCGRCRYCASSDYQRCSRNRMVGGAVPGGFAEFMVAAERHAFPV